jgi:hypothetical protein
MIERVPISSIKPNPANPRVIRDAAFASLKRSLDEFPEMMEIRPIAVRQGVILGGNMRFRAAQALGWTHVHVIHCDSLTDEQAQRFIIADNVTPGEWDWEALANEWDAALLEDWGLNVPDAFDYSDKNKEIDVDSFDDEMIIKLKYTEDEYHIVKGQLQKIAQTPEQAVWKLLGNE